jgi:di/tricarboxylate transporter
VTLSIAWVYVILLVSLVLFITEKIRVDLVALLVLVTLATTGMVTSAEAFSGFSNAAVITVWAMFIISAGLTRTGIARIIGDFVLRLAGSGEVRLIAVIMLFAAGMSAFMNNIGVAALLLPVTIRLSRSAQVPPSRLLLPLAVGSLLGGLTTLVGTPPNILVSNALAQAGQPTFGLFDFTPVGGMIVLASIGFFLAVGRKLLPSRTPASEVSHRPAIDLQSRYGLNERAFVLRIPPKSVLDGTTIRDSRLTRITGLKVVAVMQFGRVRMFPGGDFVLRQGQQLLVQGRLDRLRQLRNWNELIVYRERSVLWDLISDEILLFEVQLAEDCALAGTHIDHAQFRKRYRGNVLGVRRDGVVQATRLSELELQEGDRLLVQGSEETLNLLEQSREFSDCFEVSASDLVTKDHLADNIFIIRVPSDSIFVGRPLYESGIADLFDFRLLGTIRKGRLDLMPAADEVVVAEDRWLIQGAFRDIDVLRGFQELEIDAEAQPDLDQLRGETIEMAEIMLAPGSELAGKPVSEIQFPEKYGLELMAIWREGRSYRTDLDQMELKFGDAFLLMGPRDRLELLEDDSAFLVLTPVATRDEENTSRARVAVGILAAFVTVILTGLLPIETAAVSAAALMVLTGCLTMDQAYRAIEWRSIFLIAGMLPLGIALQTSGAAEYSAMKVLSLLGDANAWVVIFSFYLMTALATLFIPTSALVVLMAPIVLTASDNLGISPLPGMMAIAIAASASFASPVSHPANLLVMGPGGYRFADYLRVGIPLTLVVFLVTVVVLPFVWPL